MAGKTDISTAITLHAARLLRRTQDAGHAMIPYGPMKVKLSPGQAYDKIMAMSPEDRGALAQSVGVDNFVTKMQELEAKARRKPQPDAGEPGPVESLMNNG